MTPRSLVGSKTHSSSQGAKATVVAILSVAAPLVVCALIFAFAMRPPTLGWVGFAIVSIIVLGLAGLAPLGFEYTRVSARPPAGAVDQEQRLLVIADAQCSETALRDEIFAHLAGAIAVHLVVPVRVSRLHFLTDDETDEQREARQRMRLAIGLLQQVGISTTGSVGSDKPLESMVDALGSFAATRVLLAIPPEDETYWLERDLLAKARLLTDVPVTQVTVPSTPPMAMHDQATAEITQSESSPNVAERQDSGAWGIRLSDLSSGVEVAVSDQAVRDDLRDGYIRRKRALERLWEEQGEGKPAA